MPKLAIKSTHKVIKDYYAALEDFDRLDISNEGAVRSAFQSLLQFCARQVDWTLVPEHSISLQNKRIIVDAALIDDSPPTPQALTMQMKAASTPSISSRIRSKQKRSELR